MILGAVNPARRRSRRPCCAACAGGSLGDSGAGATVPLASALAQLVKALPKCATGRQLVQFLNGGLELTAAGGFRLGSSETAKAGQALSDAINSPASIGIEIPWFPWSDVPTYCAGAAPREKAISLVTRAVGSASGDIGATAIKIEAVKELAADLAKPPFGATDWGSFAKKIGIGIAAVGGIYVGGKYIVGPYVAGRVSR